MILGHAGLSFGKLGLWDPRCDTRFFDLQKILDIEKELSIQKFPEWVVRHEIFHRSHLSRPLLLDMAGLNLFIAYSFFPPTKEKKKMVEEKRDKIDLIRKNGIRIYEIFDNIDPIFDAYFAFEMHLIRDNFKISDDEFATVLASNLTSAKSREYFYELVWIQKNEQKLSNGTLHLVSHLMRYSLSKGMDPFLISEGEKTEPLPREYFDNIISTYHALIERGKNGYETFKKVLKTLAENDNVSQKERIQNYIDFEKMVISHNPNHKPLFNTESKIFKVREPYWKGVKRLLFDEDPWDKRPSYFRKQQPLFEIIQGRDENDIILERRKNGEDAVLSEMGLILTLTHTVDLIRNKKKPKCLLCATHAGTHSDFLHESMDKMFEYYKPIFKNYN